MAQAPKPKRRKIKIVLLGTAALLALIVCYFAVFPVGQRADSDFDASVPQPIFQEKHPVVLFDEGHYNAHTSDGLYSPFARLIENDGYEVRRNTEFITAEVLRGIDILTVVNASGGSNPKLFGFNLVPLRKGKRDGAAFKDAEVRAIQKWVEGGGSLLLIADHYPFGLAASSLAQVFGTTMLGGFTEVENQYPDQNDPGAIIFTRENGLLADHPITSGRSPEELIGRVMSFTGQSLNAINATPLLLLPESAVEYLPPPPNFEPGKAGTAQVFAMEYGKGRVVIFGEAGMLTAQVADNGERFGMNVGGLDNKQFALNVMHWLTHLL